jgi:hypothetical protein
VPSFGNREYEGFRPCPVDVIYLAVGSGIDGNSAISSNLLGENRFVGAPSNDSMLITLPFSGLTRLARLVARLGSSCRVLDPVTGSTK